MIRRLGAAAMALGAMLAATALTSPAFAGDAPVTPLPLSAGGVTYQECTWNDGASPSHFTICALMKGWDYTNNTTHSWSVDSNGLGHVSLDALNATAFPNGLNTSEKNSAAIAANTAPTNAFNNSATGSASALAAAATYTGPSRDVGVAAGVGHRLSYFNAFFLADQAGTGYIDCSNDNSTWYVCSPGAALAANTPVTLSLPVMTRYHRARVVNGSTAETILWVNSSYTGG